MEELNDSESEIFKTAICPGKKTQSAQAKKRNPDPTKI